MLTIYFKNKKKGDLNEKHLYFVSSVIDSLLYESAKSKRSAGS